METQSCLIIRGDINRKGLYLQILLLHVFANELFISEPGRDKKRDRIINEIRRIHSFLHKFVIYAFMKSGHFSSRPGARRVSACLKPGQ